MTKLIIFLNGPINSGKDTLGETLVRLLEAEGFEARTAMFKDDLYKIAAEIASVPLEDFVYHATDRTLKEAPWFVLPQNFIGGTSTHGTYFSPRDWLIHVSERIIKKLKGPHVFGELALRNQIEPFFSKDESEKQAIVFTDTGFPEEYNEIVQGLRYLPGFQHRLVHIYREGCAFHPGKDSRNYLPNPQVIFHNNGTLERLIYRAKFIVDDVVTFKNRSTILELA